ncbi:hypothetical protein KFE25_004442 [Diacronema lutheri]|uniref:Tubulin--tyrosine ligase-like protein 5 n=1 Tax=Diacronema lutheri TaxID=2081491 RepID=A0A8J6C4G3_DIALT|nr:hypothetical protein KFE25_004442 [Diacronema lutheri]
MPLIDGANGASGATESSEEDEPDASVAHSASELSDGEDDIGSSAAPTDRTAGAADAADAPAERPRMLLLRSLFVGRPSTVWFGYAPFLEKERTEGQERVVELTDTSQLPLLFKSERTINCVCQPLKRSGFRRLLRGSSYHVLWGSHLTEKQLRRLRPHQRINHFPGSYGIGRKDYLWKNFSRMQREHPAEYNFCAKTYLLPADRELFERDFKEGELYIVKPPASAEGRGIRMLSRREELPSADRAAIVQRYVADPLLIDGTKFDLRIYVAVTSFDPLRVYVYEEGLGRFATAPYSADASRANLRNRFAHLTNYALNKRSAQFVKNTDADADAEGSKWSLSAIWRRLAAQGVDVPSVKARIHEIAVKAMLAVEPSVVGKLNAWCHNRATPFELFGLDILLDASHKPWLIEVNVACSLSSSSPLDKRVKHALMTDLFHLVGVVPSTRKPAAATERASAPAGGAGARAPRGRNIFEMRATPLRAMGEAEWELVMHAEDEHARRGGWERAFPCEWARMERLLALLPTPRYRLTVLAKWEEHKDWALLAHRLAFRPPAHLLQPAPAAPARTPPRASVVVRRASTPGPPPRTAGASVQRRASATLVTDTSPAAGHEQRAPPLELLALAHAPLGAPFLSADAVTPRGFAPDGEASSARTQSARAQQRASPRVHPAAGAFGFAPSPARAVRARSALAARTRPPGGVGGAADVREALARMTIAGRGAPSPAARKAGGVEQRGGYDGNVLWGGAWGRAQTPRSAWLARHGLGRGAAVDGAGLSSIVVGSARRL